MKITNKKILNITTIIILVVIPLIKFLSHNLELFGVISNYDSINPGYIFYFALPFLIYVYIRDIIKQKRKLDIYDYIFYVLVFAGIIATIFSININLSIFGKDVRHEGLLAILCYYLLVMNWKVNGTKDDIKKYINLFIIMGVVNSIYALFQIYTDFNFILRFTDDKGMANGLCGNPNFLGSLIVTLLGIIITKFLMEKKISIKNILLIILFFITLINAQSTGPFLTLIITIIFLIIYLFINKKIVVKNILYLIIILLVTYASLFYINKSFAIHKKCETCDFFNTIINNKEEVSDEYSITTGRLDLWKKSLVIVKDNFITGVGFDNFHLAYPNPKVNSGFTISFNTNGEIIKPENKIVKIYDNAHNTYLHTLTTTGILGLIPYLLLCLLTFIHGLKSKYNLGLMLLGGFVAYSVQAFANISVIQVAPIYYVIMGLILSNKE